MTVGEYEDGRPGEVFIKVSKQGSTLAGIMDAFSISLSLGLQHGVPLATFVRKFANMKFEPAGHHRRPGAAHRHQPHRLHLPPDGARLPLGGGAHRARHPLHAGADAADAARRGGDGDAVGRPRRGRAQQRPGRLPTAGRRRRWPGPSSSMRPSATAAATPCSGRARATSAGVAGRPAGLVEASTGGVVAGENGRRLGRSSSTRRSATTAATPCSGPDPATSAGAAGRRAGARSWCRPPIDVLPDRSTTSEQQSRGLS